MPQWVSQDEFGELVGLNFAIPGVSVVKLAAMIGMRAAGWPGVLVSVVALVLPGLLLTVGVYALVVRHKDLPAVVKVLNALQYGAVALLATTVLQMLPRGSDLRVGGLVLAVAVFAAVQFLKLSPFAALIAAAVAGLFLL